MDLQERAMACSFNTRPFKTIVTMKTTRREFMQKAFKATAITSLSLPMAIKSFAGNHETESGAFQFSQVALPYAYAALEPSIDALTMEIHYTKHHATYIKNVNEAITAEKISFNSEKDFFASASKLSPKARNNGGGAWNHNFFWESMKPNGGAAPAGGPVARRELAGTEGLGRETAGAVGGFVERPAPGTRGVWERGPRRGATGDLGGTSSESTGGG